MEQSTKTWSVQYEGNDGEVIVMASGMTIEQAEKMAETETVLSIDELNGRYVIKEDAR